MYRIRLHGRGGQGMRTAGRILGRALFMEGFEVQDAPRYGAERRGAPMFAYVRAAHDKINERGVIKWPDLVLVADETLVPMPAAGILQGCDEHTVLLIRSDIEASKWRDRLNFPGTLLTLPLAAAGGQATHFPGAACIGAAARLLGNISQESLETAVRTELAAMSAEVIDNNLRLAMATFEDFADFAGLAREGTIAPANVYLEPEWVTLTTDSADIAAPAIHAGATSEILNTGLWRTARPVIDYERCNRCWWICNTFCPDGAIHLSDDRFPQIDYDHCKGCLICVHQCPTHAISVAPEPSTTEKSGGRRS